MSLEASILHKMSDGSHKPVFHASRTLLPAEKNYPQIDESLGIIFAVTKFHRYIHGRHFTLQMNHKPLFTIFSAKKTLYLCIQQIDYGNGEQSS